VEEQAQLVEKWRSVEKHRQDRRRRTRKVQQKKKGHVICPNCSKETDFILRKGEALVWCRRCRRYFRVCLDVMEADEKPTSGSTPEEEEQPEVK
jgi:ribosomal protein L37AE/L43A